jgi:hypothetical protein
MEVPAEMSEMEKFMFDLQGYLVVRRLQFRAAQANSQRPNANPFTESF